MADANPSRPSGPRKEIDANGYVCKPDEKIKKIDGRTAVVKKGANGNEIRFWLDEKKA